METKELDELTWRKKAIRLSLKGLRPCEILRQVPRSRPWLRKWLTRFADSGWPALTSQSRAPQHAPHEYPARTRALVIRVRRSLQQRRVGLIGARAVRREIQQQRLLRQIPGLTTINRWLKQAGLIESAPPAPQTVCYPEPSVAPHYVLHAMDWTARYLEGGVKVFAFHTIDHQTRALHQTITASKSRHSLLTHVLEVWQTIGLPHGLELDNDAALTGGEKTPRRFSHLVRRCLYLGIEPLFVPPGEPKRNHLVERLNGLWAHGFWERDHFRSVAEVKRKSRKFVTWYTHHYLPPALSGLTPAAAQRRAKRRRLTKRQRRALPDELPITAGRLHFIRRVGADGQISFLGEHWRVSQRLAHQYVWATVITHRRRMEIYHQRSARSAVRLVKTFHYAIPETVCRLRPEYKR